MLGNQIEAMNFVDKVKTAVTELHLLKQDGDELLKLYSQLTELIKPTQSNDDTVVDVDAVDVNGIDNNKANIDSHATTTTTANGVKKIVESVFDITYKRIVALKQDADMAYDLAERSKRYKHDDSAADDAVMRTGNNNEYDDNNNNNSTLKNENKNNNNNNNVATNGSTAQDYSNLVKYGQIRNLSFTSPLRKKMHLMFYSTEIHLQSVVTNKNNNNNNSDDSNDDEDVKIEARIQVKNIVNIAVLPTPDKTKDSTTIVLILKNDNNNNNNNNNNNKTKNSKTNEYEYICFNMLDEANIEFVLSQAEWLSGENLDDVTSKDLLITMLEIVSGGSDYNHNNNNNKLNAIHIPRIPKEKQNKQKQSLIISCHHKAKEGHLFLLNEIGLLWGLNKPLRYLPFKVDSFIRLCIYICKYM